jgi:hypothetical protein
MRLVLGALLVAALAGSAHAQGASAAPGEPPASPDRAPTSLAAPPPAPPAPVTPGAPPATVTPAPPLRPADPADTSPNPAVQFLVGGVAGTLGLFAGAVAGYGVHCMLGCHSIDGSIDGIQGLLIGAAIGLPTATAAGVMYGGFDRDHAGSFGWTWLGAAAGGTAAAIATRRVDNGEMATAIVVAGAALGGTIAFDLSRTRRRPSTAIRVVPLISGGSVQLALVGAR